MYCRSLTIVCLSAYIPASVAYLPIITTRQAPFPTRWRWNMEQCEKDQARYYVEDQTDNIKEKQLSSGRAWGGGGPPPPGGAAAGRPGRGGGAGGAPGGGPRRAPI